MPPLSPIAPARVLLADIPGTARRAIATLIGDIPGATLAGQVDSAREIPDALRRLDADVLLLDDRLVTDDESLPRDIRLIVLGLDDDPSFAARALRLGAEAWVPKEVADDALHELLAR